MNETLEVFGEASWEWYRDAVKSWFEDLGVEEHDSLNLTNLRMDQAYVVGHTHRNVGVYSVSDDCFRVRILFYLIF